MRKDDYPTPSELGVSFVVDAYLSAEVCRAKAVDCAIRADALDDPRQKAAMLKYAEWWRQLADYRAKSGTKAAKEESG